LETKKIIQVFEVEEVPIPVPLFLCPFLNKPPVVVSATGKGPAMTTTPSINTPPKLALSRTDAAEALGISAVTVDRLTKRGLLKPSRATRRPLYPVWEIERFLRETSTAIAL